jgi:hypothetical protein
MQCNVNIWLENHYWHYMSVFEKIWHLARLLCMFCLLFLTYSFLVHTTSNCFREIQSL